MLANINRPLYKKKMQPAYNTKDVFEGLSLQSKRREKGSIMTGVAMFEETSRKLYKYYNCSVRSATRSGLSLTFYCANFCLKIRVLLKTAT
jgi:hypothetical protein